MQTPQAYDLPKLTDKTYRRRTLISLTPLIDVVFILLVFFMLASSFLEWRAINLNVSSLEDSTQTSDSKQLLLSVGRNELQLNGESVALDTVLQRSQHYLQQQPDRVLQVQPLADTPLQFVVTVLDSLQAANITRLTLVKDTSWQPNAAQDNGAE